MNSFPFQSEQSTTGIQLVQPMSDYMWSVQAALFIKTSFKQHVRLIFPSFPLKAASSACWLCMIWCVWFSACVWMSNDGTHTLASGTLEDTVVPIYLRTTASLHVQKHRFMYLQVYKFAPAHLCPCLYRFWSLKITNNADNAQQENRLLFLNPISWLLLFLDGDKKTTSQASASAAAWINPQNFTHHLSHSIWSIAANTILQLFIITEWERMLFLPLKSFYLFPKLGEGNNLWVSFGKLSCYFFINCIGWGKPYTCFNFRCLFIAAIFSDAYRVFLSVHQIYVSFSRQTSS